MRVCFWPNENSFKIGKITDYTSAHNLREITKLIQAVFVRIKATFSPNWKHK